MRKIRSVLVGRVQVLDGLKELPALLLLKELQQILDAQLLRHGRGPFAKVVFPACCPFRRGHTLSGAVLQRRLRQGGLQPAEAGPVEFKQVILHDSCRFARGVRQPPLRGQAREDVARSSDTQVAASWSGGRAAASCVGRCCRMVQASGGS